MVADTKFDLVTDPVGFLTRGLHLWDPQAAFGQLQNQAYGYAWPMGPFFVLGHAAHVPEWAIQRAWWALLLCLAFFGVLRLAQRLAIGSPLTQVVAAFAFVLTPRITTLLGSASAEVWPMALAPWVLLPLIRGSERGSVRRAAAMSALVVACCGGVNAVAVAAVLPLGVIWILTRARGPRKWRLLAWWTGFTLLATAWWSGPLLLLGRYSVPFLDYIENATITSVPTDLARTLVGVSDWVAYFAGFDYPAGREIVATPFILLDAAVVAAIGLVGIGLRAAPHQRFLVLSVVTGAALVGFGYAGDVHGFWAADRLHALDQALAPLRNLHKFDVVLRLPLVLGLAHALTALPAMLSGRGSVMASRLLRVGVVFALIGIVYPWINGSIAPRDGVEEVPSYWSQVARYLDRTDEGSAGGGVALVVPGATFGIYTWGNVHDDVMQGLARSPWAVRNVIPLAQPGNVTMLDAVTRAIESGHPSPALGRFLAANGIDRLVVRNDLDRLRTGSPDPAYVRSVLGASDGLVLERSFGPRSGEPVVTDRSGTRVIAGSGLSERVQAIDVYRVTEGASATLTGGIRELVGDPGTGLDQGRLADAGGPALLAGDTTDSAADAISGQVLTDGGRRRESNFSAIRSNQSATTLPDAPYRLVGPEHDRRLYDDAERWYTTEQVDGATNVTSSSSEAYADALPPLSIGDHPAAALDGDPATAWESARHLDPTGQWWQIDLTQARALPTLQVQMAPGSAAVQKLRITLDRAAQTVDAPEPGESRTYSLDFPPGRVLRITAAGRDLVLPGSFGLSDVRTPGEHPQRYLTLPRADERRPVDEVSLSRDLDRNPCVLLENSFNCSKALVAPGEDGDTLARRFSLPTQDDYRLEAIGSFRRGERAGVRLARMLGVRLQAPSTDTDQDLANQPVAMLDGDPTTSWISRSKVAGFTLTLPRVEAVDSISVDLIHAAPASRPTGLIVTDVRTGRQAQVTLDDNGNATLPGWRTDEIRVLVRGTAKAFLVQGRRFAEAPAGISELRINGRRPVARPDSDQINTHCGTGPTVLVGGVGHPTRMSGSLSALMRGMSMPLSICGTTQQVLGGDTSVLVKPRRLLRADSVSLVRAGTAPGGGVDGRGVDVRREADGMPTSVRVPERDHDSVLTLPQNLNDGWRATLHGDALRPQRVDGWKQGWLVPAGAAGTVSLSFAPGTPFRLALGAGLVLLLVVGLACTPLRLRFVRPRELPPLVAGRPGVLDLGVVVVGLGLLAGWFGLGAAAVAAALSLAVRRLDPKLQLWGPAAGAFMVLAGLGVSWSVITERDWAQTWTQCWSVASVALLCGVLVPTRLRSSPGEPPLSGSRPGAETPDL